MARQAVATETEFEISILRAAPLLSTGRVVNVDCDSQFGLHLSGRAGLNTGHFTVSSLPLTPTGRLADLLDTAPRY